MGRAEDLYTTLVRDGEAAIDDMIARRQTEELFLDFKRSSDRGAGKRLSPDDRENLARAISGFGNSEGGVIVWGWIAALTALGSMLLAQRPLSRSRTDL